MDRRRLLSGIASLASGHPEENETNVQTVGSTRPRLAHRTIDVATPRSWLYLRAL